jgi:hypothetical protein
LFQEQVPDLTDKQVVRFDDVLSRLRLKPMHIVSGSSGHVEGGLQWFVELEASDILGVGSPN